MLKCGSFFEGQNTFALELFNVQMVNWCNEQNGTVISGRVNINFI